MILTSMPYMGIFTCFCICFKSNKLLGRGCASDSCDLFFELRTLQIATNFFSDSNHIGQGLFGPVYKGLMPNGQEVAVKKLSLDSGHGLREFTNEQKVLSKITHKNLVTLMGCCVQGPERMLVYEYLPNKTLDYFLYDKKKSPFLDWTKRFDIITGIVRGLLYLQEEAPQRIIHGDIKASNILLDDQLNPKISSFGFARMFPRDQETHVNTLKISGTQGYMAPEYAMHGYLSVKTDVFSFGILLLEIISGRKNHDGRLGDEKADLLDYASSRYIKTWKLFGAGKQLQLVDERLSTYNPDEAGKCIQLGLLCCQSSVKDRPDIKSVHLMLSSGLRDLSRPGKPGFRGV